MGLCGKELNREGLGLKYPFALVALGKAGGDVTRRVM